MLSLYILNVSKQNMLRLVFYLRKQGEYEDKCQGFTVVALLADKREFNNTRFAYKLRERLLCVQFTHQRVTQLFSLIK